MRKNFLCPRNGRQEDAPIFWSPIEWRVANATRLISINNNISTSRMWADADVVELGIRRRFRCTCRSRRPGMVAAVVMMLVVAGSRNNISGNSETNESEVIVYLGLGSIEAAFRATLYPEICMRTLLTKRVAYMATKSRTLVSSATQGEQNILGAVFHEAEARVPAKRVCYQTLASSIDQLRSAHAALLALSHLDAPASTNDTAVDDIKTALSAAMEFHTTCPIPRGPCCPSHEGEEKVIDYTSFKLSGHLHWLRI